MDGIEAVILVAAAMCILAGLALLATAYGLWWLFGYALAYLRAMIPDEVETVKRVPPEQIALENLL